MADLDREEAGNGGPIPGIAAFIPPRLSDLSPEARNHRAVARFLPPELAEFLERMRPQRRVEREKAILAEVEWAGLEVLGLPPTLLAERADQEARRYAAKFPKADADGTPINQEQEHRKGRCQKWQLRRLRKRQRRALLYVEQAVGAVGGPAVPGRPLFLSDYGLVICEAEELRTLEILGRQRLAKKSDLSVQIPMLDLHWKAKAADAAKKRMLIDVHLARWAALGWHVCWLTVTLPGEYVANATNEGKRVTKWDVTLGPEEASKELQDRHHRTLALLREKGVRLNGWWNVQPQQSGTPHRHYVTACETLEDARKVCDEFHRKFDTGNQTDDGQDRGCSAYVIGDDHPDYAMKPGKNGKAETAESVARYTARYSTKYEARPADAGGEVAAVPAAGASEQKRFRGWKKLRGARGMGFLGLDSQRAPLELWDVLWLNSLKEDHRWSSVEDARMSIGMREMRTARRWAEEASIERAAAKTAREVLAILNAAAASISADEIAAAEKEVAEAEASAREAADLAAFHGWHAAIASGLWPDADLDSAELAWLSDAVTEWNQGRWALPDGRERDTDPLPPVPLRETRESVYGVTRNEIRGAVGVARRFTLSSRKASRSELFDIAEEGGFLQPFQTKLEEQRAKTWRRVKLTSTRRLFFLAARDAGIGLSRRPDGTIAGYDLSGEILLRSDDEWIVVTVEEAERLREELAENGPSVALSPNGLSFSATDPSYGPDGPSHGDERPPG
ncbi:replication endonuclease [Aminobacter sp. AP02]|uniref:replication endonuclease n=1 Tax=Aminobacter sp. AP02 TaxID=2135737 RepID=UPI000D6A8D8E|nr:replication endonuclease [Aminobacter sp. AP02]PWK64629.1 bacteriophage replication gene A protein [Aminobacter sp. AP02]